MMLQGSLKTLYMKGRIVLANLELAIVDKRKPTKSKPINIINEIITLKKQVLVGTTPMEVMAFDKLLPKKIENMYEDPVTFMIRKMEVIYFSTKTQYDVK